MKQYEVILYFSEKLINSYKKEVAITVEATVKYFRQNCRSWMMYSKRELRFCGQDTQLSEDIDSRLH